MYIYIYICIHMYIYIYIERERDTTRASFSALKESGMRMLAFARGKALYREFTKGGLVKGGVAIRHVFNLHIKHRNSCITIVQGKHNNC